MNKLFFLDYPTVKPFIISVWYGVGKPTPSNDYFSAFVNELNELIENGLIVNDNKIRIKVRCFICDTPGRCLIKGLNKTYFHYCVKLKKKIQIVIIFLKVLSTSMLTSDVKNALSKANFSADLK